MSAVVPVVVAIEPEDIEALDAVVAAGKEAEQEWLTGQREDLVGLSRREAAERRREIRVELARMRTRGEFAGTRDLVVARALRQVLLARGLDQEWPEPPAGEVDAPGRRWGTSPSRYGHETGDGGLQGRLAVRLPADLATTARRAAYWTSAKAIEGLREWDARWGNGPSVALRNAELNGVPAQLAALAAAGAASAPQSALEIREALRARILTTGDLVRAAVTHAIAGQTELPL